ncbi:hypothetical protein FRC14_006314 [Serendipita sp. 396]|nr:hypothetical protein FRC14_006314 [Serendipita sp. 396]KAG8777276.1 hypothetical protein FRC15_011434 [Serendipita sp. 397]KAG8793407.1 hypothetical protein FRC16_010959 [Serendipita sp. 398]
MFDFKTCFIVVVIGGIQEKDSRERSPLGPNVYIPIGAVRFQNMRHEAASIQLRPLGEQGKRTHNESLNKMQIPYSVAFFLVLPLWRSKWLLVRIRLDYVRMV